MPPFYLNNDMNIRDRNIQRRLVWGTAIIMITLLVISIPRYPVDVDEAWLGEQVHFLVEDGVVRSELFTGILQYDKQLFVYHKGLIWFTSLPVAVLGFDLTVLRLVPLVCFILLCWMLYLYYKENSNRDAFLLTVALLLLCPVFFHGIKIFRPELPVTLAGFASFSFLMRYLRAGDVSRLVLSSVCAGLAILIHLNGVIFLGAGVMVLLFARRWKAVLPFGVISIAVALLYFVDVLGHQDVFFMQLQNGLSNAVANVDFPMPVKNLLAEHKRLLRKPEIIGITVLFVLSLILNRSQWKPQNRPVGIYVIVLVCMMGLLHHSKTVKYSILQFPFFAMIVSDFVRTKLTGQDRLHKWGRVIVFVLLVGYGLFGMGYAVKTAFEGKQDITATNRHLAASMESDSRVIAPLSFVFNEIDHFDIMGMVAARTVMERDGLPFTPENVCRYAVAHNVSYLIINDYYVEQLGINSIRNGFMPYRFMYLTTCGGYHLYQHY